MPLIKSILLTILLPIVLIVSVTIVIIIELKSMYHLVIFDILKNWLSYKKNYKKSME